MTAEAEAPGTGAHPGYVTAAWAEWRRQSGNRLAEWGTLFPEQQARFAAAIEVAVKAATDAPEPASARYAVVEAMGHRTLIGAITDATVAGKPVLRITRLDGKGEHYLAPDSLYMVTPCSEAQARAAQSRLWTQLPATVQAAIGDGKPDEPDVEWDDPQDRGYARGGNGESDDLDDSDLDDDGDDGE